MLDFNFTVLLLVAASPCASPEARAFDFWIGEWTIENRQANPADPEDPTLYPTGTAEMRVYPVAGGCALVEHWEGRLSWGLVRGFSLRTFDSETGKWLLLLNWPPPGSRQPSVFSTLEGSFRHGRGEFFSDSATGRTRFTFSDIGEDRYRWDAASSSDGGSRWKTTWIMEGTRNAESARPVLAGVDRRSSPELCTSSLGSMLGRWASDDRSVEIHPILGGCAVMEFLETPERETFAVHTERNGEWVRYEVHDEAGGWSRFTGARVEGGVEWSDDGGSRRERLCVSASDELVWESLAPSGTEWAVVSTSTLKRR